MVDLNTLITFLSFVPIVGVVRKGCKPSYVLASMPDHKFTQLN